MTSISRLVAYSDSEDDRERGSAASPIEIGPMNPPAAADPRLLPPPNFTAQDRATLIQQLGEHTLDKGYAVVLARSSPPRGTKSARIEFKCDIGGVPRDRSSSESQGPKRPNAGPRLIDCPFKATALQAKGTLNWSFYWWQSAFNFYKVNHTVWTMERPRHHMKEALGKEMYALFTIIKL
ncbi:hypothetical protein E4U35_003734 [Claviceps purpurea]|nr:hypothetical protein E4U35_003734 [Claviceps purpurea]